MKDTGRGKPKRLLPQNNPEKRRAMIHEYLQTGADHPTTGKQLATLLKCDIRDITEAVERERRDGLPICANSGGENSGYYLAADQRELEVYCKRLRKRAGELFKTRRALLDVLKQLPERVQQ